MPNEIMTEDDSAIMALALVIAQHRKIRLRNLSNTDPGHPEMNPAEAFSVCWRDARDIYLRAKVTARMAEVEGM